MSKLLILGAGGHARVVREIAELLEKWETISFLDDNPALDFTMGVLNDYESLAHVYDSAFVAFGNNALRIEWSNKLRSVGYVVPALIHPLSIISSKSSIGSGTAVMAGSIINANTIVGNDCIINTASSVDHDCHIDDGVHLSPGVRIAGHVNIGTNTWVGIGSIIVNNITVGCDSIIAAGAVVTKDVSDHVMVAGVPAQIKKHLGV